MQNAMLIGIDPDMRVHGQIRGHGGVIWAGIIFFAVWHS